MREFMIREFNVMTVLWQGYADELANLLDRRVLKRMSEIETSLSAVGSVILDLDELLSMERKDNLDQDRAERARQLRECYRSRRRLLKTSMLHFCTNAQYDRSPAPCRREH